MYAPYIRNASPALQHNASILDAEIVYGHRVDRMRRVLWLASAFIVACGVAGWLATLPLA